MKLEFLFTEELKTEFKALLKETIKEELSKIIPKSENGKVETKLLSRKEAAEFLGCSLTSLYTYMKNGLIPFRRIGRKVLFEQSELVNHMYQSDIPSASL